jgi:diguanylate cyclase (GGDEF)-like protein
VISLLNPLPFEVGSMESPSLKEMRKKLEVLEKEINLQRSILEMIPAHGDLTVSIGTATFSPPISTLRDLIREVDNALYRAKEKGRNRIEG